MLGRNYHLKFVVRENQSGRMGTFETDVQIPDLRKRGAHEFVVLSSQVFRRARQRQEGLSSLVQIRRAGAQLTHVFTRISTCICI